MGGIYHKPASIAGVDAESLERIAAEHLLAVAQEHVVDPAGVDTSAIAERDQHVAPVAGLVEVLAQRDDRRIDVDRVA